MAQLPSIGIGAGSLLVGFLILFIIYLLIVGFVLWVAGEIVVGRRVTFGEALAIAGVGTFLVGGLLFLLPSLIGLLAGFVLFLALIKHYFKTGWFGALGVTVMALIVGVVLTFILGAFAIFSIPTITRFL